ncbi:ejaculatory bulb-specific protein 3-like [Leptinotarsa decemlineata]|uniref:ejaculatory bulb-specific protein 3-like n=1 Tax=Leptinotarsa decemlineata TaxID=7539 RepID=UPI003D304AA8
MKCLIFFVFLGVLIFTVSTEKYSTKYDNVNVDEILKSDRLLKNYMDCLMDRGPCTTEGKELKEHLPDALKTECSKCSDKQKETTKKVIKFLIKNKRPMFDELVAKYDPENIYKKKYKDELAKEGITL